VAEPQSSASRVVCRCPEWRQAVSGVLQSAATLTNRSGEGASCCALWATSSKHGPRGPEAVVGSGDESPPTNKNNLCPIGSECQGSVRLCQSESVSRLVRNVPVTRSVSVVTGCSNSCSCLQSRLTSRHDSCSTKAHPWRMSHRRRGESARICRLWRSFQLLEKVLNDDDLGRDLFFEGPLDQE